MSQKGASGSPMWIVESSGDSAVADPLLLIHILAGGIALLAGIVAIFTLKGGSRHNRAGQTYVVTMAIVVVTAFPLSIWTDNWFLFAIAVFTGYLIAAGYRIVLRRRSGASDPKMVDYVLHGTMLLTGIGMVAVGGAGAVLNVVELGSVLAVFGAIGATLSVRELRQFRVSLSERTSWIERHIAFMGGGYIATVTATITVNLTMVPPIVRWLGPTFVGVPLIFYSISKYKPRFSKVVS